MIPLPLGWFVFVYLALFLAGILFLWIGYELVRKHDARRAAARILLCRICGSRFPDPPGTPYPGCPACGNRIERSLQGEI